MKDMAIHPKTSKIKRSWRVAAMLPLAVFAVLGYMSLRTANNETQQAATKAISVADGSISVSELDESLKRQVEAAVAIAGAFPVDTDGNISCGQSQVLSFDNGKIVCATLPSQDGQSQAAASGSTSQIFNLNTTLVPSEGLALSSAGLSLLDTCSSGQILKWNGSAWACAADASGIGSGGAVGGAVNGGIYTGIMFVDAGGNLAHDTANFNYDPSTKKLTVTGGIDPLYIQAKDTGLGGGSAAYFEAYSGQNASVATANTGRIRYNAVAQNWEVSENTGAYVPLLSSADTSSLALSGDVGGTLASTLIQTGAVTLNKMAANAVDSSKIVDGTIVLADLAGDSVDSSKIIDGTIASTDLADGSVTTIKIVDGSVSSIKIADNAITTDKLNDDSVASAKIIDGTVDAADLANATVTNIKLAADAITTDKISDGSVTTTDLADGLILTAKLADGSITSAKIADGTIVATDLADNSVASSKIQADAITSAKIVDAAITTADLDDGVVATAKLQDGSVTLVKMAVDSVDSSKVTDGSLGMADLANSSVGSLQIVDGSITASDISDSSITLVKLGADSVDSSKILDGTIVTTDLATGSVTTAVIADGAVASIDVADGAISTSKLAADSVTGAKIVDGTISTADLADASVTDVKLAADAVTGAKVLDGTLTSADIADGAVVAAKLADGSVATAKLGDGVVTTIKLADGAATLAKLASDSIDSSKIIDGSVAMADLADAGVTLAKLADCSADNKTLRFYASDPDGAGSLSAGWNCVDPQTEADGVIGNEVTNATAGGGLARSGSGTAGDPYTLGIATNGIATAMLNADAVTSAKILDGTVTAADLADSIVGTLKLADGSVTTQKLGDDSVTSAKLVDGTILTADLADGAINTLKITDGTVTLAKLAADAVNSAKIVDGSIALADLAGDSVDSAKIVDATISNADISTTAAIAYAKLNLAGAITATDLAADSVNDSRILDGSILAADLAADAVTSAKILDGSITDADIAASAAIALSKLANGTNGQIIVANASGVPVYVALSGDATIDNTGAIAIANLAVTNAKLAADSVDSVKIVDGSIVAADLAADAVTTAKVLDGTLVDADVDGSANIALSKLASGALIVTNLAPPSGSSANGASIASNTLTLSLADASNPGLVSTSAQTFAGDKTFNGALILSSATASTQLSATDNTASFSIKDNCTSGCANGTSTANTIFKITDLATNFGGLVESGAFIANNSMFAEEFAVNKNTTAITADNTTGLGDSTAFTYDTFTGTTTTYTTPISVAGGVGRFTLPATSGTGFVYAMGRAVANYHGAYLKANLPVMQAKIKPSVAAATDDYRIGFIATNTAASGTNDVSPTNGIYFSAENGTNWVGVVRSGGANVGTVTCSAAISTTQFAVMRIQVESATSVRFLVDGDASNGVSFTDCGAVSGANPTAALTLGIQYVHTATTARTLDIDYLRTWQDDSSASTENALTVEISQLDGLAIHATASDSQSQESTGLSCIEANSDVVCDLLKRTEELKDRITKLEASSIGSSVANAVWSGGVVSSDTTFNGKVILNDDLTINSQTRFNAPVYVSGDTAGTAVVKSGQTSFSVTFDKPYTTPPRVVASPKQLAPIHFAVVNVTTTGFDISISPTLTHEIGFDWIAIGGGRDDADEQHN